uniref:Uncharacterized protein n=1 Tax=Ixodes ricinus TaxID=34613 RepID=A0A6B0UF95_IXORI
MTSKICSKEARRINNIKTETLLSTFRSSSLCTVILHQLTMLVGDFFMALTSFICFGPYLYFNAQYLTRRLTSTTQRSRKLLKYTI